MVLSGTFGNITSPLGFGVVNATRSGALSWRHVVTRRGNALAAAVDAAGDIVTAGFIRGRGEDHFIVAALSRANGSERWRVVLRVGTAPRRRSLPSTMATSSRAEAWLPSTP